MEPAAPSASPQPRLIVLALALALALIGTVGAATGAADNDSDDLETAGRATTTSVVDDETTTTAAAGQGVSATTLTTLKNTPTTKGRAGSTATTAGDGGAPAAACAGTPSSAAPAASVTPPSVGTFTYVDCKSGQTLLNRSVTEGQSGGGVTRRVISASTSFGQAFATTAYGTNGVVQESMEIRAMGQSANCNWEPDIVEYAPGLAVGKSWSVDSRCTVPQGSVRVTGTRKVTGIVQFVVGGTSVTCWVVEETQKQEIKTGFGNATVTSQGFHYFDPSRGMALYEKANVEGTGLAEQQKQTLEARVQSLTPSAS